MYGSVNTSSVHMTRNRSFRVLHIDIWERIWELIHKSKKEKKNVLLILVVLLPYIKNIIPGVAYEGSFYEIDLWAV